jgi:hypothetical protein
MQNESSSHFNPKVLRVQHLYLNNRPPSDEPAISFHLGPSVSLVGQGEDAVFQEPRVRVQHWKTRRCGLAHLLFYYRNALHLVPSSTYPIYTPDPPIGMASRRACDRCHKFKEKCTFHHQATKCSLCQRSKSVCTTIRLEARQGRRPKAKPLGSYVSTHVWDLGLIRSRSIGPDERPGCVASSRQQTPLEEPIEEPQSSSLASHSRSDEHILSSATPPLSPAESSYSFSAYQVSGKLPNVDKHMPTTEEPFYPSSSSWMMKRFYVKYDIFMLGLSFARGLRTAVQQTYLCSPELLRDILVAISPITLSAKSGLASLDQSNIVRGTGALQKLRTAQIASIHDASAVLALGQTLAAFDLLTQSVGPISILRSSLLSIAPWYDSISKNSSLDPVAITPIFWDTIQCLIRCEVPVIKFVPRDRRIVDHTAGVCSTLLPILYDLCVANHTLKFRRQSGSQIDTSSIQDVQERLLSWVAEFPEHFTNIFTNHEVLKMEAQALMYHKTGLLICHRVLNPLGTLDYVGIQYAEDIMKLVSKYSALLTPGTKLQNVTFPVLVAALEIADISKEIWEEMPLLAASPTCAQKMRCFIEFVWLQRRRGCTSFIFDLVDEGPEFVVIP